MEPTLSSPLPINGTARSAQKLTLAQLKTHRLSHQTKHPAPMPVIRVAGANYGLQGMISGLTGPPKSGKTTVIGYMLAGTLAHVADPSDVLKIQSALAGQRDVVYLDFEQHVSSTQDLHDKILRYAGLTTSPDNLHILNLLGFTMEERKESIDVIFRELDVHLLIVDGVADLLPGANNEESSVSIVEKLVVCASHYNACVVVVIHENRVGTSRGHVGAQVERKCAGMIAVRKDRDTRVHSIESKLIRVGGDFDDVCFRYSEEHQRMVLLDAVSTEEHIKRINTKKPPRGKDHEFLTGLMKLSFDGRQAMLKDELVKAIMKFDQKAGSPKTAGRRIDVAVQQSILILDEAEGFYTRPN